jgi:hypothetical protein
MHQAPGAYPGLARASLFSPRHQFPVHVGRRCYAPLCESTCPPPSGPQFPIAKRQLISSYEGTRSEYPVTQRFPSLAPSPENLTSKPLRAFRGSAISRCISTDAGCGQATDTACRHTIGPRARNVAASALRRIHAPSTGFSPALPATAQRS